MSSVTLRPASGRPHYAFAGLAVAAALALGGCQNKSASLTGDNLATSSISPSANAEAAPSFKKTGELAKQWEKDRGNAAIGFAYADALQKLGQGPNATAVIKAVADANAGNAEIQAQAGRKLLTLGATAEAAAMLERAVESNPQDWQSLSALGSSYDQLGRNSEAREQYKLALAIKPDAVATRNNLAMSHALQGQLPEAEKLLRELMATGGSTTPRVRQNLALVVGLQGRFDEARKIASEDLPPDQVEANLAYLKTMLARPNTWAELQGSNG